LGSFVSSIWLFTWSFHYLFILKELFVMVRVALARIRAHLVPFFALADGTWTTDTLPTAQLPCMLFSPHAVDGFVMPMLPLPLPPDSLLFIAESAREDPIVEMVSYALSAGALVSLTFLCWFPRHVSCHHCGQFASCRPSRWTVFIDIRRIS